MSAIKGPVYYRHGAEDTLYYVSDKPISAKQVNALLDENKKLHAVVKATKKFFEYIHSSSQGIWTDEELERVIIALDALDKEE